MRRASGAAALILVSTAVMLASQAVGGPLRVAATLWFLAVVPGFAFAPALPPVARAAVVVAISLAIDTAVTTGLLVAGAYDPAAALAALTAVALCGCALAASARGIGAADVFIRLYE